MQKARDDGEVILEFTRLGRSVRVSAMDARRLVEVVVYGPASAGEAALRHAALRKLAYVLERRTNLSGTRIRGSWARSSLGECRRARDRSANSSG